jgi:hypothetical protein
MTEILVAVTAELQLFVANNKVTTVTMRFQIVYNLCVIILLNFDLVSACQNHGNSDFHLIYRLKP